MSLQILQYSSGIVPPFVGGRGKDTYSTSGSQQWTIPAGVGVLRLKLWGAAGGSYSPANAHGGGGAFVQADVAVSPDDVVEITSGSGGHKANSFNQHFHNFGGGGKAMPHNNDGDYVTGGGGGGASIVAINGIIVAIAGGGGGAGIGSNTGYQDGAPGVADSGNSPANGRGGDGSQTSGGGIDGTVALQEDTNEARGTEGGFLSGGVGGAGGTSSTSQGFSGGGGGGGYYGGAGGKGGTSNTGTNLSGAGGGGSSWAHPTLTTNVTKTSGTDGTAANTGDADYPSGAATAVENDFGGDGAVVIAY